MKYVIKKNFKISNFTTIIKTMNKSGVFCVATDEPRYFESAKDASEWFMSGYQKLRDSENNIYIEGPRGGNYSAYTGNPLK